MKKIFEYKDTKKQDSYEFILKINLKRFDEYHHGHPYQYICNQLWLGAKPEIVERKTEGDVLYWIGNCKF
jgi:hypothetical protein